MPLSLVYKRFICNLYHCDSLYDQSICSTIALLQLVDTSKIYLDVSGSSSVFHIHNLGLKPNCISFVRG